MSTSRVSTGSFSVVDENGRKEVVYVHTLFEETIHLDGKTRDPDWQGVQAGQPQRHQCQPRWTNRRGCHWSEATPRLTDPLRSTPPPAQPVPLPTS